MTGDRRWEVIGAPFGWGSSHRGCENAPVAIRAAGLTRRIRYLCKPDREVTNGGDVKAPPSSKPATSPAGMAPSGTAEMAEYAPRLMARVDESLSAGRVPIVLGGDHSVSIATVSAASDFFRRAGKQDANIGLVWIDAHPDLETPGPDSTNALNAMAAAHLIGRGLPELHTLRGFTPKVKPEHLVAIGLRDVVSEEKQTIHNLQIIAYTASDIERSDSRRSAKIHSA